METLNFLEQHNIVYFYFTIDYELQSDFETS